MNETKKVKRQYSSATVKRLCLLSGNNCAWPGCPKRLIGEDEKTIVGKIAHIEGVSTGGPRHNSLLSETQVNAFDNLILLCDEHHSIIDNKENEDKYTKGLLTSWKKSNESFQLDSKLKNNPSLLFDVVNTITSDGFTSVDSSETEINTHVFKVEEKITHNNVIAYRAFIDEYKVYSGKLDVIYKELDQFGGKKEKLLRYIKMTYLKHKSQGGLTSDQILESVEESLVTEYKKNQNNVLLNEEDVRFAVVILVVDAFIRCKILERPN
jgi:hypothetical protein